MSIDDIARMVALIGSAVGVVSASVAVIASLWRWRSTLAEQSRRLKLESAELAWKLANVVHEDPVVVNALELVDGESTTVESPHHGAHEVTEEDLRSALGVDLDQPASSEKDAAIRQVFDSMFYALDRLRSATEAGLVSKEDLSEATIYYCKKFVRTRQFVLEYGAKVYPRTVSFVRALGGPGAG